MSKFLYLTPTIDNLIKNHNSDILQPLQPSHLFESFINPASVYKNFWGLIKTENNEYTFGYFLFNWLIKLIASYDPVLNTKVFGYNQVSKESLELYVDFVLPYYTDKDAQLCCYKIYCLLANKPLYNYFVPTTSRKRTLLPSTNARVKNYKRRYSSSSSSSFVMESLEQDRDVLECANSNFADQYAVVKTPTINTIINLTNGTTDEELNGEIDDLSNALMDDFKETNDEVDYEVPYVLNPNYIKNCSLDVQNSVFHPMNSMYDLLITLPPHHYDIISKISYFCELYNVDKPDKEFEKYLTKPCESYMCVVTNEGSISNVRPPILHHKCVYDVMYEAKRMTKPKFLTIISALAYYIQHLKSKSKDSFICAICLLVNSLSEEKEGMGLNLCNIVKEFRINKSFNIINTLYTVTTAEEESLADIKFERVNGDEWIVKYRHLEFK